MKALPAQTDFVVIGAGIAGLRAAIELAEAGRVLLLSKREIPVFHSRDAKGEAEWLGDDDEITLHLQDTLEARSYSTGVEVAGDGEFLVLGNGEVIALQSGETVAAFQFPVGLSSITINPAGGACYITNINSQYLYVVEGFQQQGYPVQFLVPIGVVELVCTILYLIPRTSVLGAILLTGYLGGATATHVRAAEVAFIFPVSFGVLLWLGLYLRDSRIRALVPLRR